MIRIISRGGTSYGTRVWIVDPDGNLSVEITDVVAIEIPEFRANTVLTAKLTIGMVELDIDAEDAADVEEEAHVQEA